MRRLPIFVPSAGNSGRHQSKTVIARIPQGEIENAVLVGDGYCLGVFRAAQPSVGPLGPDYRGFLVGPFNLHILQGLPFGEDLKRYRLSRGKIGNLTERNDLKHTVAPHSLCESRVHVSFEGSSKQ